MMRKYGFIRILAALFCVALLCKGITFAVYAQDAETATETLVEETGEETLTGASPNLERDSTDGTYLIGSAEDWQIMADYVAAGNLTFNDTFKLTADIDTTIMVGNDQHRFTGHFDGNGHTINVNFSDDGGGAMGLFRYAENVMIYGLRVKGNIYSKTQDTGGFIGKAYSTVSIVNCRSSVTLDNRYTDRQGYVGGFVAHGADGSDVSIMGSLFDGKCDGNSALISGGFVGHVGKFRAQNSLSVLTSNYFEYPFSYDSKDEFQEDFFRNCLRWGKYSRVELGTTQAYRVSTGDGVSIDFGEKIYSYNASGIILYDAGILAGDVFYVRSDVTELALDLKCICSDSESFVTDHGTLEKREDGYALMMDGNDVVISDNASYSVSVSETITNGNVTTDVLNAYPGETVTLSAAPEEGYVLESLAYNDIPIQEENEIYSFVMPGKDVLITASFAAMGPCGKKDNDVFWRYKDGVLTVFGTGKMTDYSANGASAPWSLFKDSIVKVAVEDGVTDIGNSAFYEFSALETVDLSNSVKVIGSYAFAQCRGLPRIDLPEGLTDIGPYAFDNCTSLKEVIIPDSVTTIGDGAFYCDEALERFVMGAGIEEIPLNLLYDCSVLETLTVPANVKTVNATAFYRCRALTDVYFESDSFGEYAFEDRGIAENFGPDTILHIPVDPSSLSEESGNSIYCWYQTYPERVVCDERYTVNVSDTENGTVIAGYTERYAGETVYLKMLPSEGYELESVSASNEAGSAELTQVSPDVFVFTMMNSSVTVSAEFAPGVYDISVDGLEHGEIVSNVYRASMGDEVRLTVSCDRNYFLDSLSVIDSEGHSIETTESTDGTVTFLMPGDSVNVSGVLRNSYGIIIGTIEHGEVYADVQDAKCGDSVTLTYAAESGYGLKDILVQDSSGEAIQYRYTDQSNSVHFIMPPDEVTVQAVFGKKYTITVAEGIEGGTVSVPWTAAAGETVIVLLAPDKVYYGDDHIEYNGQRVRAEHNKAVFEMPDEDVTITTEFYIGGTCGEDLEWRYNEGVITITGTGEMTRYPWRDMPSTIPVTNLIIEEGLTKIMNYAFRDFSNLESVVFPESLRSIGDSAFFKTTSLKEVVIPEGCTTIGGLAFEHCESLESVTLPSTLTSVGEWAFGESYNLAYVDLSGAAVSFGREVFAYDGIETVEGAENIVSMGDSIFYKNKNLKSFVISDNLKEIPDYLFYDCTALEEVTFGKNIEYIGTSAFYNCPLKQVVLPEGLQTIDNYAFIHCESLESIYLPDSITTINVYPFASCNSIKELRIPEGLVNVVQSEFYNIPALITIHVPAAIKTLDGSMFEYSKNVEDVYFYSPDLTGYTIGTDLFKTPENTVLHILYSIPPETLTEETGGSIYTWYQANPASVVNDIGAPGPSFKKHSLALGGAIGVNFFMDLPASSEFDYEESYMEFTVNGKNSTKTKIPYKERIKNTDGTLDGFTCTVTSIQMAEEITAVFHYRQNNEDKTIEEKYTVRDYIRKYVSLSEEYPDDYSEYLPLVKAMADYGHYVQIFLSEYRGWTIGEDYAEMDTYYTTTGFTAEDAEAVLRNVEQNAFTKSLNAAINKVTYSLSLDSDTSIYLFIKPADNYTGGFTATVDGKETSVTVDDDGRFKIIIPNIKADYLGKTFQVELKTDTDSEVSEVSVSAFSYVRALLKKANLKESERNAMVAFYRYYEAAYGLA